MDASKCAASRDAAAPSRWPCRLGGNPMARILIFEDEPDIALGLQLDLREEGYEVEVVHDGEEAGRVGRQPGWDLIVLDVMLPRKDGFDVCRDLRRGSGRTPRLICTAKAPADTAGGGGGL